MTYKKVPCEISVLCREYGRHPSTQPAESLSVPHALFKMPRKGSNLSAFSFSWCVHLPEVLAISQIELNIWPHLLRIGVLMTYFSLILNFLFRPQSKESRGFLLLVLSNSSAVHFHVKVTEKLWNILQEGRPAGVPSMDLKCSVICS